MKVALLGDTHFGVRGDSLDFHEYFRRYYQEHFFPTLERAGIDTIIQVGDLFDRRKFINIHTLFLAREYFFNILQEKGIRMITILGNHDIYFKDTLEVNSPSLLLKDYGNIEIIEEITTREFGGTEFLLVPWIIEKQEIPFNDLPGRVCVGHFEINGFQVTLGNDFKGGLVPGVLAKFEMVISGHFHHKSSQGNITFIGTPTENTWSDYGDPRGFHILDTQTLDLQFIPNPSTMFHKVIYDDTKMGGEYWDLFDFNSLKGCYVKFIIMTKTNQILLDSVLESLENSQIGDLKVIEVTEELTDHEVNQAEDTMTILEKYVDNQDGEYDKLMLKNLLREVYIEAVSNQGCVE